jgi:hypothetical protein
MDFSEYYNVSQSVASQIVLEREEQGNDGLKAYVDKRIDQLEERISAFSGAALYNVIPSPTEGRLVIVDIDKGSVVGNISPRGKLISMPLVFGEKVSFAVQSEDGQVFGTVHSLPDGEEINKFRVGPARTGFRYRVVMGREDEPGEADDDIEDMAGVSPEEIPIGDKGKKKASVSDLEKQLKSLRAEIKSIAAAAEGEQGAAGATGPSTYVSKGPYSEPWKEPDEKNTAATGRAKQAFANLSRP